VSVVEEDGVVVSPGDDATEEARADVVTADEGGVVASPGDDESEGVEVDATAAEESGAVVFAVVFAGLWISKYVPAMGWMRLLDNM
jgi:hypothetical protein